MSWFDAPFSEQAIFWLGLKVFWWKRIVGFCQIVLGSSVLLTLLSHGQKVKIHAALADASQRARGITVPPVLRGRTILKWVVPVVMVIAAAVAGLVAVWAGGDQRASAFAVAFVIMLIFLGVAVIPITALVTSASMLLTTVQAGRRYVPPLLAWLTHHQRVDRTLVIVPFLLFVIFSLLGLYFS